MEILKANTIKQTDMKDEIRRKGMLLETKFCIRNLIRDKNLDCPPYKILGTILEMNEERTPTNGAEEKKADDDAQGLTSER